MKTINCVAGAALALIISGTSTLQAQVFNTVAIAATAQTQGGTTQVGTTVKTAAPIKLALTTKSLLASIAVYEFLAGHYAFSTFPVGAKLVAFQTFGNAPTYAVYTKTNVLLVNCSDIMTSGRTGSSNVLIHVGTYTTVTQLAFPSQTNYEFYILSYNDTALGGSSQVKFNLLGSMTHTRTDGKPNVVTLLYNESQTNKMAASAGDGTQTGQGITITGSLSYSGTTTLLF